eukprot:TRINITY_DN6999_c0_g1_i1.p1 TRINITY_DN6999_c0_g1~~TRINITY_DN6999_c0_g1_i1.p1  ORF type:complete len:631 (-),score=118.91 TRINITY_DN6999_c0_g1_i1:227-2119(-)
MVLEEVPFGGIAPIKQEFLKRNADAKTACETPSIEHSTTPSHTSGAKKQKSGDDESASVSGDVANESSLSALQENDVAEKKDAPSTEVNETTKEDEEGHDDGDDAEGDGEEENGDDPNSKKKRKRGMNKNRPPPVKHHRELCTAIAAGDQCRFGENCKFNHDVALYLSKKPADISDDCPLHNITAKCTFGYTCRFASGHSKPVANPQTHVDHVNIIEKSIQHALRKRQYNYKRANEAIKSAEKPKPTDESTPTQPHPDASSTVTADLGTHPREKTLIDFRGKLYLAPLTTVGNLPFRRVCKRFGADITCGEMAVAQSILQGNNAEWALMKRHPSEDIFGVQLCGNFPDVMTRCAQVIDENVSVDFVDVNSGCPVELFCMKGSGCALMERPRRIEGILRGMSSVLRCPVTIKMRIGQTIESPNAHKIIPNLKAWGASAVTIHGRSKQQRYTKVADWDYIRQCADQSPVQLIGNGDILSWHDYERRMNGSNLATTMIARGALIKPWLFTEIKERRDWDISSRERLDILKDYVKFGLEHWGTDDKGVSNTRRFILEWLSFLYRYIPVGLLEVIPQHMNARPMPYYGRDDLETLMGSPDVRDWIKISELLLGPAPDDFKFIPKHKSNSYEDDRG